MSNTDIRSSQPVATTSKVGVPLLRARHPVGARTLIVSASGSRGMEEGTGSAEEAQREGGEMKRASSTPQPCSLVLARAPHQANRHSSQ